MNFAELIFVLGVVGATTLLSFAAARWIWPGGGQSIAEAVRALFDWAGIFTIFLAANLAVGAVVIFLVRSMTSRFVAIYALENILLLGLSGAQAFIFQIWWYRR